MTTTEMTSLIPRIRVRHRARNIELALLIFAMVIAVMAFVLVQIAALHRIDTTLAFLGIGLGVLVFAIHFVLRFTAPDADPFILPIATVLNGIGIAEIYRIDIAYNVAGASWEGASTRQIVWTGIAIVCALVTLLGVRNHRVLQRYTYLFGFIAFILVLLPMFPGIGRSVNGSRVWIGLGPFTFQPGELAKLALAVFFAGYLSQRRDAIDMAGHRFLGLSIPRARDLGPLLLVWLLSMSVIVFQRDLGTALLYFGLFLVVTYVATGRWGWVISGIVLFVAGAMAANQALGYVHGRFLNWLDPFSSKIYNADGGSYQLVQGLFGLGHGGLSGTGLGLGTPTDTPLANSDYILSSLGEELGMIGLFAIFILYMVLCARAFRIGFSGEDDFGKLLAIGLGFSVALQIFIVAGGVMRVIPETGLTSPFLAAGGSSLVANWIIVALVLRLSNTVRNQTRVTTGSAGKTDETSESSQMLAGEAS